MLKQKGSKNQQQTKVFIDLMPETRSLDENDPDAPVEDVEGHEVDDGRRHRRLVDVLKPGNRNIEMWKIPRVLAT